MYQIVGIGEGHSVLDLDVEVPGELPFLGSRSYAFQRACQCREDIPVTRYAQLGAHLLAMMGWPHYLDHLGDYRNERPVVTPISESSDAKHLRLVLLFHVGSEYS